MWDMKLWLPENLDMKEVIRLNKSKNLGTNLNENKLLLICHFLVTARAKQRKKMIEKGISYAELSSSFLDVVIHDYKIYLQFLIAAGVIETDRQFIIGKKCFGFKFSEQYEGRSLKLNVVNSYKLCQSRRRYFDQLNIIRKKSVWGYSYLTKWLDDGKLTIDEDGAIAWIEKDRKDKIVKLITGQIKPGKKKVGKRKYVYRTIAEEITQVKDTAEDFKLLVRMFEDNKRIYKFSGEGNRFYSVITNMKKEIRSFIKYDGKELVDVDIKNSQPFLSMALLNTKFWEGKKTLKLEKGLKEISKELYGRIDNREYENIITLLKNLEMQAPKGLQDFKYCQLVTGGCFYEYIQEHFCKLYPYRFNTREMTKKEVMRILFYNPKYKATKFYKPCETFENHFKEVSNIFDSIKKKNYKNLPLILQRVESYLVIDKACKLINCCYPDIPIFTIHDNIITTKGNEGVVKNILRNEIEKYIGIAPTLDCSQPKAFKEEKKIMLLEYKVAA